MDDIKALELFRKIKNQTIMYSDSEIDEAIAELEALQQHKSCDNCEYESGDNFKTLIECGTDIHICALCKRGTNDYFKPKEQ